MNKKLIAILFVVSCLGLGLYLLKNKKSLKTTKVSQSNIVEAVYAQGIVKHEEVYDLKIGVTSGVDKSFVQEGQKVKKGEKLIQLDSTVFEAPFDGVVMKVSNKKRETIYPQGTILSLVNLSSAYIELSLEQKSFLKIQEGQEVRISFEGSRQTFDNGVVVAKYAQDNQFLVKVKTTLSEEFYPGMSLDCAIILSTKENALVVPYTAISNGSVVKLEAGEKKTVPVTLGLVDEEKVEVLSSELSPGDELVVP